MRRMFVRRGKEGGEVRVQSEAGGMESCLLAQAYQKAFRESSHMHSKLSLRRCRHQCFLRPLFFVPSICEMRAESPQEFCCVALISNKSTLCSRYV